MGFLTGFVGGMAGAYNDERDAEKLDARKKQLAEYESQLQQRRMETEMELRNRYQQETEKRAVSSRRDEEAYQSSDPAIALRKQRMQGDAQSTLDVQTGLIGGTAKLKADQYAADKPLQDQQAMDSLNRELTKYRLQTDAQTEAEIAKFNNPEWLAGARKKASATHIDDGAPLRALQVKLAQQSLDEKEAELKMPYAERQIAAGLREQIKSKAQVLDKATVEGTAMPEGISKINTELGALNQKLTDVYKPYVVSRGKKEDKSDPFSKEAIAAFAESKKKSTDDAKPPIKVAEEVPRARAEGTANVDKSGRVIRVPGDDQSPIDKAIPAIKEAASNVVGVISNAHTKYLQEKMNRNEQLTPMELAQAKRAGLIK